jgi:hypothetical protein
MLGVPQASVPDLIGTLRASGAIEYERGMLTVGDRKALERSACGCYSNVRHLAQRVFEDEGEGPALRR